MLRRKSEPFEQTPRGSIVAADPPKKARVRPSRPHMPAPSLKNLRTNPPPAPVRRHKKADRKQLLALLTIHSIEADHTNRHIVALGDKKMPVPIGQNASKPFEMFRPRDDPAIERVGPADFIIAPLPELIGVRRLCRPEIQHTVVVCLRETACPPTFDQMPKPRPHSRRAMPVSDGRRRSTHPVQIVPGQAGKRIHRTRILIGAAFHHHNRPGLGQRRGDKVLIVSNHNHDGRQSETATLPTRRATRTDRNIRIGH